MSREKAVLDIDGAKVFARRGRYRVATEEKLRALLAQAFEDAEELPSFACIERGEYSLVVLKPHNVLRVGWSMQITAPTYRKLRAALRSLGLVSRDMRERDFTAFVHS